MRRAVTRKAVWPIILCPGRTARPSTCQSRTRDSQACGSVNPPCSRTVSTNRESCGVEALPRGQHVEDDPVAPLPRRRQRLREVAERQLPRGVRLAGRPAEELADVAAGDVGELLAALERRHPAVRAD